LRTQNLCSAVGDWRHQSFGITARIAHRLRNTGAEPLLLMFSCPQTHVPSDRYFVEPG
jgi:hypothetical protein